MLTYEEIIEASSAGSRAAAEGKIVDDCPYPVHTIPQFFWISGWMHVDNKRIILMTGAVVQWAVDSLSSIEELLAHYDEKTLPTAELLEKIMFVRQKLEEKL